MTYEDNMTGVQTYDPDMDLYEKFGAVVDDAKYNEKFILLFFGSNWFSDRMILYKKMHKNPLNETIDKNFIFYKAL